MLAAAFTVVGALSGEAAARAQQNRALDGLVARCTTVNTSTLPQASLERYGVGADEDQGLLSCVVQKRTPGQAPRNVEARVSAEYHAIGQAPEAIPMREVREHDLVTYLGTYAVPGRFPLQFRVSVTVPGAGTVELELDDRTPRL